MARIIDLALLAIVVVIGEVARKIKGDKKC